MKERDRVREGKPSKFHHCKCVLVCICCNLILKNASFSLFANFKADVHFWYASILFNVFMRTEERRMMFTKRCATTSPSSCPFLWNVRLFLMQNWCIFLNCFKMNENHLFELRIEIVVLVWTYSNGYLNGTALGSCFAFFFFLLSK